MFLLVPLELLVRVSASFDSFRAFWLCWPFAGAFEEWHVATFQRQTATAAALFRVLMGLINIKIINMLIIVIAEPNSISSFIAQKSYSMAIFLSLSLLLSASLALSFFHLFNSIMFFFFGYYVAFTSSLCSLVMITSYFFLPFFTCIRDVFRHLFYSESIPTRAIALGFKILCLSSVFPHILAL